MAIPWLSIFKVLLQLFLLFFFPNLQLFKFFTKQIKTEVRQGVVGENEGVVSCKVNVSWYPRAATGCYRAQYNTTLHRL